MKSRSNKDPVTIKLANDALAPLVAHRRKTARFVTDLTERLSKKTKRKWAIQKVMSWLHPDPSKRHQPLLGPGLLLLQVGKELMSEHEAKSNN